MKLNTYYPFLDKRYAFKVEIVIKQEGEGKGFEKMHNNLCYRCAFYHFT